MATRRQIREAFYAELATAASEYTVSIGQDEPNSEEELPAIRHNDLYRELRINRGNAPTRVTRDSDGDQEYIYSSQMEAQFTLTVISDDEQEKEDLYEDVRSHFEAYTHPIKDASDLQTDVYRIEVTDAESVDMTDRQPRARGDALEVNVFFERLYTQDVTPTTEVDGSLAAGVDTTREYIYGLGVGDVLEAGETFVIEENESYYVIDTPTIDGTLQVDGYLLVLDPLTGDGEVTGTGEVDGKVDIEYNITQ